MKAPGSAIFRLNVRRHFHRGHAIALGVMLGVFALMELAFLRAGNAAGQYLAFNVSFYFTFVLPLLAFIGGGGAWRDELKPEAADYFLLRGVPKPLYLLLRYAAHVLCAEIDFAAAFALLLALGAVRHVPGLGAAVPAMLSAQLLCVAAYSAFGFLCAVLTGRWIILGLVYGAVVEIGLGDVPLAVNRLAMSHQARVMLHSLLAPQWSGPDMPLFSGAARLWASAACLIAFAAGFAALAALAFSRQEIIGDKPD